MTRTEHLLTIAIEECCETAQRITKAARFGLDQIQIDQPLNNRERIVAEYSDLIGVMRMLGITHDEQMAEAKIDKVERYLGLSAVCGTLQSE